MCGQSLPWESGYLQLEPQGAYHIEHGGEGGVSVGRQGLVQALPAESGLARDGGHALGAGDVSECGGDDCRVAVLECGFEVTSHGSRGEERVHERDVHVCVTVEGNTNSDGSANGHTTLRKVRTFREGDGQQFVRWVEMERRAVAA